MDATETTISRDAAITPDQAANPTPTPWYVYDNGNYLDISTVDGPYGPTIAETCPSRCSFGTHVERANAELIVAAVNAHEGLVAERDAALKHAEILTRANAAHLKHGEKMEGLCSELAALRTERDELRAALEGLLFVTGNVPADHDDNLPDARNAARAALRGRG